MNSMRWSPALPPLAFPVRAWQLSEHRPLYNCGRAGHWPQASNVLLNFRRVLPMKFRVLIALCLSTLTITPAALAAAPVPNPPAVDTKGYVLMDFATGQVLAGTNAEQRLEPASLTKLMTTYVVFDALRSSRLKMDEQILISEHAWRAEGSRTFVQVGTRVPVDTLIKGMIVQSGNDATIALAERVGGTEPAFVEMMNVYAKRLGMNSSHFEDSTGLPSPQHYTTPTDLATLSRAIIRDFPQYYGLYSLKEFTYNNIRQENRNGLLERDPSVDGMKTGHTDAAGYCLISSAKRQNMRLVSVVMGSPSVKAREDASEALLNFGFTNFETVNLKKAGETVLKPRIYKGTADYVAVGPMSDVLLTVPRGESGMVVTQATVNRPLIAPVDTRTAIGELQVSVGDKVVAKVPMYPLATVGEGSLWRRMVDTISLWL
jgi:D-alanyl-D-alanine carboxypeptidase (penicillin-binding protein 5/6)